jgi:tetratricopeptide (TPR) repeat protein
LSARHNKPNPSGPNRGSPPRSISKGRLWVFRWIALLLPFLLLAVLEISLRLFGYGYDPHFFKRIDIGGEEFFVQNEDFSRRFFPKAVMRNPGPMRFYVHKAPGTVRVFVLGESAAMGDPAQSFAPDRYLDVLLRQKYPGTNFEVINVAFTAINSHVILPIARECAAHEGDLWIVYMGNNEMVGPFGAATVFGWQAPPLPIVRAVLAFQRLRTGQWLMEVARNIRGEKSKLAAWGGMAMFLNNQVPPESPRKETVYRNFQKNLDGIVRAGVNSGAKVLLNTVAVNLKDCPPFASITNPNLSSADRAQFDQLYTNAIQAMSQKDFSKATEFFERAARLDSKCAELQFHWGECLLAKTNRDSARERFRVACDNDALPFRADSRINAAIRAEPERVASKNLILFDSSTALAPGVRPSPGAATSASAQSASETGISGEETFYEHVHFDFDARYRLGRAWAEQMEPLLGRNTNAWASQSLCDERLGLSPWNRAQVIHFMLERIQTPPLSTQPNNERRKHLLETRMAGLRPEMNSDNSKATRKVFLNLVEQRPEDFFLHQEFAVFLEVSGDPAGALAEWQRFREMLPQDSLGHYQTGRLLITQQRYAEAESALRTAVAIRPSRDDGWVELGNALALRKKYPDALASYSTALKLEPQNAQTLLRRGKVLGYMNRRAEAMESYRAALQLNPADGLSHYELGVELLAAKEFDAAGKEFGEAARLTPDRAGARFNYGTWLISQNRWDEAQREFEAVLRLEPGNVQAQQRLAALKAKTKRGE